MNKNFDNKYAWNDAMILDKIQEILQDKNNNALLLHILGHSGLLKGLTTTSKNNEPSKSLKLISVLRKINPEKLVILAQYYPGQPAPNAHDLLRILKRAGNENSNLKKE